MSIYERLATSLYVCEVAISFIEWLKLYDRNGGHMQPVMIIPSGTMSKDDIALLNANGICAVESKEPDKVKLLEPLECLSSRNEIEVAAIKCTQKLLNGELWNTKDTINQISGLFLDILKQGTMLDPRGSQAEQESQRQKQAKWAELEKLGREEAQAERAAVKAKRQAEEAAMKQRHEEERSKKAKDKAQ